MHNDFSAREIAFINKNKPEIISRYEERILEFISKELDTR